MAVQLLSKSAYARHRGCDEKAVRKAIAEGRISTIDGKIDPAVADIQWAQNTRARADSRGAVGLQDSQQSLGQGGNEKSLAGPDTRQPAADGGYHDARARREQAEAERAEMEVARMAGRLVERDATERAVFDAFRALRDATFSVPARASAKVLGMAELRDIEHVIADELRKAFEGWEDRMLERLEPKEGA